MQKKIYGYENSRYRISYQPHGECRWYMTRKERDAARESHIEHAKSAGLDDPEHNFRAVYRVIRTERQWAWLEELKSVGMVRESRGMMDLFGKDL